MAANITPEEVQSFMEAICEGDSITINNFLHYHPDAVRRRIFSGQTPLVAAINANKAVAVEKILDFMLQEEDFELTDNDSPNPFMLACYRRSLGIVDLLYRRRWKFVKIPSGGYILPVIYPIVNGNTKLMWYLYWKTLEFLLLPDNEPSALSVLECSIRHKKLDLALDLFNRLPVEDSTGTLKGEILLHELARAPEIFPSHVQFSLWIDWIYSELALDLDLFKYVDSTGTSKGKTLLDSLARASAIFPRHIRLSPLECLIYSSIEVELPHPPVFHQVDVRIPMEQYGQTNISNFFKVIKRSIRAFFEHQPERFILHRKLWDVISSRLCIVPKLNDLKLKNCYAKELLRLAIQDMPRRQFIQSELVKKALFKASEEGIVEIFVAVLKHNPASALFSIRNEEGRTLLQHVVHCRQGKIFSLVYAIPDKLKENALLAKDKKGNNSLQIAAKLASDSILARVPSPGFQMRDELKWFKEVARAYPNENIMKDTVIESASREFTESHKDLKRKGEEWFKGVATSSTVVGALLITIMFAAAFTVPGGYNSNSGLPIFLHKKAFRVFILADAISLFTSATSVLTFLGILCSHYEEEDFLMRLPDKLFIALFSLFVSIATMLICFCATVIMMLHGDLNFIIPIILLAVHPLYISLWTYFVHFVEVFAEMIDAAY